MPAGFQTARIGHRKSELDLPPRYIGSPKYRSAYSVAAISWRCQLVLAGGARKARSLLSGRPTSYRQKHASSRSAAAALHRAQPTHDPVSRVLRSITSSSSSTEAMLVALPRAHISSTRRRNSVSRSAGSAAAGVRARRDGRQHRGLRPFSVLLDFAVSADLVFGQRAIYALGAEERSRVNALFMATFFAGGAIASGLSGWSFARFG